MSNFGDLDFHPMHFPQLEFPNQAMPTVPTFQFPSITLPPIEFPSGMSAFDTRTTYSPWTYSRRSTYTRYSPATYNYGSSSGYSFRGSSPSYYPSYSSSSSSYSSMSGGVIAGIVIGVMVFLALCVWLCIRGCAKKPDTTTKVTFYSQPKQQQPAVFQATPVSYIQPGQVIYAPQAGSHAPVVFHAEHAPSAPPM